MRRFVIDVETALRIGAGDVAPAAGVELLAPTLLRSEALDVLYRRVRAGALDEQSARANRARLDAVKIRYLGDAVLRRRAWEIAFDADLASTLLAEYIALTRLQGDALATQDPALAKVAASYVAVVSSDAISAPS